jgi:hypothetical protein
LRSRLRLAADSFLPRSQEDGRFTDIRRKMERDRFSRPLLNSVFSSDFWLRGLDLNQRPLGYERPGAQVSNRLYGTYGDPEVRKSTLWTPYWESIGSAFLKLGFV